MSQIQVERNLLLTPLQAVSGVVERRHTLPILSNVLLELGDGVLSLTATDLEIQVSSQAETAAAVDSQLTTVSARKLHDILRALPDDAMVAARDGRTSAEGGESKLAEGGGRLEVFWSGHHRFDVWSRRSMAPRSPRMPMAAFATPIRW